jgi:Poly A polymerase head domain
MKLRELLHMMTETATKIGASTPMICGGTPRDRYLDHLENIADLDITTGDKTVDYLSQEFEISLRKKYKVTRTTATDGHSTIHLGNFKMDFSSNFNAPNIEALLLNKGIKNPTDMQKEMFSRDFTCNSLLLSFDLKQLFDPTHQGFKDIKDRIIRTCLAPEITLTTNKNRVIRAIYLASKLDFEIDPAIITFVQKNPQSVKIASNKVLIEKLDEAFKRDPDKAIFYLNKMNLWEQVPITKLVEPYYMKIVNMPQKKAYFMGGGGVNEPTPGKTKYKADDAITVQPRFVEPFYRNYDLYLAPGVDDGPPAHTPGVGYHHLMNYKSVKEYLSEVRKFLRDKYVADDSYITEDNYKERTNKMKIRANLLNKVIKLAKEDENDHYKFFKGDIGLGTGFYENVPEHYKSVSDFVDNNALDFQFDNVEGDIDSGSIIGDSESYLTPRQLGPIGEPNDTTISPGTINLGDFEAYPYSAQLGGYLDKYLPQNDFEDKPDSDLDVGRDYYEDAIPMTGRRYEGEDDEEDGSLNKNDKLKEIMDKYLNPIPTHGLYGLPDGVDLPEEDLEDPTNIQPYYGTYGPESTMYEDKWNI